MNSGGVTAEVLGEPLDIGGDPVVGGGGPLPVPFRRGEGIVYCEKSKPEISSLELVSSHGHGRVTPRYQLRLTITMGRR